MTSENAREWLRSIKDNYIHGGDEAFDNARREALSMADEALRCKPCEDAVSRDLMTNTLGATCIAKRDEKGDLVALCSIDHLPSVTPKPRTGHWIRIGDRDFGCGDIVICKCSECSSEKEFIGKFELEGHRLVIDMDRVYKFCPYCGAKMAESEDK